MTWFYADNYGARAHSYALQQVLLNMGHDCVMIAYYPNKLWLMNFKMNLNYKNRKKHPVLAIRCLKRNIQFFMDRSKMYKISKHVYSAKDIDKLGLDVLVLGSDEIFKVSHPFFDELFYGVGIKTPIITYAPSAGQTPDGFKLPDHIKYAIKEYRALSVRDRHTFDLIKQNTGIDADIVLDPTFLYDFSSITDESKDMKYILVYSFDSLDEYSENIVSYAKEHSMNIICAGRHCDWANKSYESIGIRKWLGLFKNASLVITDSFHGTVFALKNKKRFVLMGREDKINKINDLMSECGLTIAYYQTTMSISDYLNEPFSYDEINKRIEIKRKASLEYIKTALESIHG